MNELKQLNIDYAKRMIVDSIWKEAHLEGIEATFPDTQEIYEGRTVAGLSVEGTVAINNLKHAWWMTLDKLDEPLTFQYLKDLNREIGAGIISWAGELRKHNVKISGTSYIPPIPSENDVEATLYQINDIKDNVQKGLSAFALIARQQFFPDGNKRTAQLVANKLLIESSSGIFVVPIEERHNFSKHLVTFYETKDLDTFTHYLKDMCLDNIFLPQKKRQVLPPNENIAQTNAKADAHNAQLSNTSHIKHHR